MALGRTPAEVLMNFFGFLLIVFASSVACSNPLIWPKFIPYDMIYRYVLGVTVEHFPEYEQVLHHCDRLYGTFASQLDAKPYHQVLKESKPYHQVLKVLSGAFQKAELAMKKRQPAIKDSMSKYPMSTVLQTDMKYMMDDLNHLSTREGNPQLATEFMSFCGCELTAYFARTDKSNASLLSALKDRIAQAVEMALIHGDMALFENRKFACLFGQ